MTANKHELDDFEQLSKQKSIYLFGILTVISVKMAIHDGINILNTDTYHTTLVYIKYYI